MKNIELIDDMICDLIVDASYYSEGAKLERLRIRLDRIIDKIREEVEE